MGLSLNIGIKAYSDSIKWAIGPCQNTCKQHHNQENEEMESASKVSGVWMHTGFVLHVVIIINQSIWLTKDLRSDR
jgi:hypothetical protein